MLVSSNKNIGIIDNALQYLYNYNRRKLKFAIEKNCVSKEQYNLIKSQLDKELHKGNQFPIEDIFDALSLQRIKPIINKELFRYNQIIIKLAQQFARNTITQQLKLQNSDKVLIAQEIQKLEISFSNILKDITNGYLASHQRNIDEVLVESGFIKESQLEFLHSSAEHLEIKAQDRKFGEIAVNNEFTTQEIVNKALDEQTERYKKTNKNHIIGDILVEQNYITPEVRNEILIIQNRVMEEDWEETLKEVGQSAIDEKEKNAMFGALVVKERIIDERKVVEALKIQAKEFEEYKKRAESKNNGSDGNKSTKNEYSPILKPRWIGDILVQEFGLSEKDRKRIVKKQMEYKIERINLKLGLNLSNAHIELFNEIQQYFELSYSKDKIEAYIKVIKPPPKTMTKDNVVVWLYNKKISYGRINNAIDSLLNNKVKPGKKVLLAKGDEPIPAQMQYKFHFDSTFNNYDPKKGLRGSNTNPEKVLSSIVPKGTTLVTLNRIKGKSGLNVNRCFVAPPMVTPLNIIKGENVTKNDKVFVASCDGIPHFSDNRVLSVSSTIYVDGDIVPEIVPGPKNSPLQFDCDFFIQGTIHAGVTLGCRQLKVLNLKAKVISTDDVTVFNEALNADIHSKGNIHIASVEDSMVSSQKSIFIELTNNSNSSFNKIYNSVITSDDILKISDSKILASVVRAKNKIILKKVIVDEKCKFIVGDSIETVACKKRIEELNSEIEVLENNIKDIQEKSRELFDKIEKKDIAAIDLEIKNISKNQKTKADLDRISELRVIKRQKEKDYEASIDKYGSLFMKHSQQIKQYQEQKIALEKDKKEITNRIVSIYKKDNSSLELDIRHTMLPDGTTIQFRYHKQVLKTDCEGFVFREEFNKQNNRYELKQHRW
ncbi:MAG: hypothetical protein HQK64_12795 [Desulfamplus sp.]|nr:hypothetical protein [Desulfamplus sp.]